jgi:hypothetical protein
MVGAHHQRTVSRHRIVKTLGERLGKQHLVPAQGASAELVAARLICFAGLPATIALSSGLFYLLSLNEDGMAFGRRRSGVSSGQRVGIGLRIFRRRIGAFALRVELDFGCMPELPVPALGPPGLFPELVCVVSNLLFGCHRGLL